MKRALIGSSLIAVLAFGAMALGSVKHYDGTVDQGGAVKFKTKVRDGKTKRVKGFVFSGVTITCEGRPPFPINNGAFPAPAMKVRHRRFHGDFSQLGGQGHFKGEFKHHFKRAHGTLRVNGSPAGLQNCDTGTDDWHASRTG